MLCPSGSACVPPPHSQREVGHHVVIIVMPYIYMGGGLCSRGWARGLSAVAGRSSSDLRISSSERWDSSSNRFREVNGDRAPGWGVSGVKWVHFLFLIVCKVWWGGVAGPGPRVPFDWGGDVMERARCWGGWERGGDGDRERSSGGKEAKWGLTFDGEAVGPSAIEELSFVVEAAEPECWWGARRGGDRSRGWDITCGRYEGSRFSQQKIYVEQSVNQRRVQQRKTELR